MPGGSFFNAVGHAAFAADQSHKAGLHRIRTGRKRIGQCHEGALRGALVFFTSMRKIRSSARVLSCGGAYYAKVLLRGGAFTRGCFHAENSLISAGAFMRRRSLREGALLSIKCAHCAQRCGKAEAKFPRPHLKDLTETAKCFLLLDCKPGGVVSLKRGFRLSRHKCIHILTCISMRRNSNEKQDPDNKAPRRL